jgi:hypothetical protein
MNLVEPCKAKRGYQQQGTYRALRCARYSGSFFVLLNLNRGPMRSSAGGLFVFGART